MKWVCLHFGLWKCGSGNDNLVYAQFSGAGQITAGNGLEKSGNTLSADLKSNGGLVIESAEIAVDLAASSITGTLAIGDGERVLQVQVQLELH